MLRLRKIEPSDLPFLYQWENDATMWADSDTHNPLSHHDLRQYIESSTGDIYRDGQLRLVIDDEGVTLGCVDLFDFDARNRKAAIGMYIAPHARGKGVGKQAVQLLLDYAFNFLHLRMVYAIISVHNTSCSHIYEQMGFTPSSPLANWTLEGDAILWQKSQNHGVV
jgi:diamine N-acetyltransferase